MGRLSCGVQWMRFGLIATNVIFLIFGLVLLGFGIYIKVNKKLDIALSDTISSKVLGSDGLDIVATIMISVAAFTVLLAGFGCCGAFWRNRLFLYLYAFILLILIVVEFAAFIVALTSSNRIRESYDSGFRETFIEAYSNNHTELKNLIESVEKEFHCCGAANYTDYTTRQLPIPVSCYKEQTVTEGLFQKGCGDAVLDWLSDQYPAVSGILGSFVLLELFGLIASIALGTAISHSYDQF